MSNTCRTHYARYSTSRLGVKKSSSVRICTHCNIKTPSLFIYFFLYQWMMNCKILIAIMAHSYALPVSSLSSTSCCPNGRQSPLVSSSTVINSDHRSKLDNANSNKTSQSTTIRLKTMVTICNNSNTFLTRC